MIPIYIINLKRSTDRRKVIEKQLRKLNIEYHFIEAIDALELTNDYIDDINKKSTYFRPLGKGEIACILSHVKAYRHIANNNSQYGLILEDDTILSPQLPLILEKLEAMISPNDAILLYSSIHHPLDLKSEENILNEYNLHTHNNYRSLFGAVAYITSKSVAENLAQFVFPIRNVIDDWATYYTNGLFKNLKIVFPFPVLHGEFLSDVNLEKINIKQDIRSKIKYTVYKHKIIPLYQLFLLKRRIIAEKRQLSLVTVNSRTVTKTYSV